MADEPEQQQQEQEPGKEAQRETSRLDDPVLERLLAQERELEALRRRNRKLRAKLARKKVEPESEPEPESNETEPAQPEPVSRPSYAHRLYQILKREV
jgi:hypothetical protein